MNKKLRRSVLLSAVLASPAVLMPTATAWAAPAVPAVPVVGVSIPDGAAAVIGGKPIDVDVTVSEATTSDAYLHIDLPGTVNDLHVTDDAGNPLALTPVPNNPGRSSVDLGTADSNENGIPGAPLTNGITHLRLAATGPTNKDGGGTVMATAVDGATGLPIGRQTAPRPMLYTAPAFEQRWDGPYSSGGSLDSTMDVVGGPETTTLRLASSLNTITRVVIPAGQLSAAGYTAPQFAAAVQVSYTPDDNIAPAPVSWTIQSDGSVVLELPEFTLPRSPTDANQKLTFHTPWDFPAGKLTTQLLRLAPDNTVLGAASQVISFRSGQAPITYHPMTPTRILDTRDRTGVPTTTAVPASGTVSLLIAGAHGVPANATSVVLNVTATAAHTAGFLSANPHGYDYGSSNLNWTTGQTTANQVIVSLRGGRADLTNHSAGTVHIVADLQGYYTAATPQGSGYSPVAPARILDTRDRTGVPGTTPVPAGGNITLPIPGATSSTTAVTLNLTATGPAASGFVTAYPHGRTEPATSSINWARGQTVANLVTLPVVDGRVVLHNHSTGTVHLIADLQGTYSTAPDTSTFIPVESTRILDTRNRTGVPGTAPLAPGASITLPVSNLGWDGDTRAYRPLTAIVLNVTATSPTASGDLSVHPAGTPVTTSNLNWTRGQTVPNLVTVPVTNGTITLTNHSSGTVHLVADPYGYYTTR